MALILKKWETGSTETAENSRPVQQAMEYIQQHYADKNMTNRRIGEAVGYSETYLCALFKQQTGSGMYNYLLHTRIARAQELILSDLYTVTEVAERCGFSGIYSFSRAFKAVTGKAPLDFRKGYL